MRPYADNAQAKQDRQTRGHSSHRLLSTPPVSPRVRVRPWWFPEQDLRDPMVLYLETWLAEVIFGPDPAVISEIEWMSQALLRLDTADNGNLAEITIFGRPSVQNRMRNVLLNLASRHREQRVQRVMKMKQLEEFLKSHSFLTPSNE